MSFSQMIQFWLAAHLVNLLLGISIVLLLVVIAFIMALRDKWR